MKARIWGVLVGLLISLSVVSAQSGGWVWQNNGSTLTTSTPNSASAVTIWNKNSSGCTLTLKSGAAGTTVVTVCGTSITLSGTVAVPSANCYGWSTDTFLQRVSAANVGVSATCGGANTGTLTAGTVAVGGASLTNPAATTLGLNGSIETGASSYVWSKLYIYVGPNAGTQGRFGWLADGSLDLRQAAGGDTGLFNVKTVKLSAGTFATCNASPVEGMQCAITDSSTATWGATITGGGANHVLGYYNGSNWTVAGK